MKIAFHLNCLTHGGAERVVTNLAGQFAEHGDEVIVATEWTDPNEYELHPFVRRVHVGLLPAEEGKGRAAKALARRSHLHDFMVREKPDVLVAFARKAIYRSLSACRGTGVPVVISVRVDPKATYTGALNLIMIRLLFGRAAGGVFQTPDARDFFSEDIRRRSVVILNPVTQKYIDAPDTPLSARTKTVVSVGRLVFFKNQTMLVHAFSKVHEKHPDYVLKIYGPDSGDGAKTSIKEAIHEHHLEDAVFLMGDCSTLEKEIRDAACFAFSSDYEGMPNALMEAMALGLPVISTDCRPGAPRMLIQSGENGLLVPVGDTDRMAQAILYMIENPQKAQAMGERARRIRERANEEIIYRQWRDFLLEVSAHGRRS